MPTLAYGRTYGPASNMNRIASVSDATESRALVWSGDGDLTQEVRTPVGGGAPVTWTYHYTYGHRLAVVVNDAAVSPLTASYHYDSDDRRTKKVVNGVTTRTMWSGTSELAEYDVNGDLIRRFIPDGTGTMDARLATVTPAGVVYWHHTDHQGSVIATSDSTGKTVGTTTYSPHGEGPPPAQSPFGYTGRQYDPETGLYYYRARYYSPYLGQFLTRDPIGTKDDPNLYMYVGLDPANATDPSGAIAQTSNSESLFPDDPFDAEWRRRTNWQSVQGSVRISLYGERLDYPTHPGHVSVLISDVRTNESYTGNGGPYPGGTASIFEPLNSIGGVADKLLEGRIYEWNGTVGLPGLELLDSQIVRGDLDAIVASARAYTTTFNATRTDYDTINPNSGTYGSGLFYHLTGRVPNVRGSRWYPGVNSQRNPVNPPPRYDLCAARPGAC